MTQNVFRYVYVLRTPLTGKKIPTSSVLFFPQTKTFSNQITIQTNSLWFILNVFVFHTSVLCVNAAVYFARYRNFIGVYIENVYERIRYIKRGTYWIRRVLEKSYSLLFTSRSNSDFDLYTIYTIETIYNKRMTVSLNNVHT